MEQKRDSLTMAARRPSPLLRYLLGLEGLALLRGWLARDDEAAARRVSELGALLAEGQELETALAPTELPVREAYAAWAPSYDSQPNPLTTVEEPVVTELLADLPAGAALDAACGTGRHLRSLAALGHRAIGVDRSPEMLEVARRAVPAAELLDGDLASLPLASESVDVAICALALSHLPELRAPIRELARVLRPGGRLVTSDIHPMLSSLGGDALFTRPDGTPAFVRDAVHLHSSYLDAFAAAGLEARRCVEPAWTSSTTAMIGKAARRIPEALEQALVGLPCVLIWELERP